jgi:hypothetical protein
MIVQPETGTALVTQSDSPSLARLSIYKTHKVTLNHPGTIVERLAFNGIL